MSAITADRLTRKFGDLERKMPTYSSHVAPQNRPQIIP